MTEKEHLNGLLRGAGLLLMTGVAAGAFGAHTLVEWLDAKGMSSIDTATRYALVMGAASLAATSTGHSKGVGWVQLGAALFSGSIYLLVMMRMWGWPFASWLGPVTPLGGILMLWGWGLWIWGLRQPHQHS